MSNWFRVEVSDHEGQIVAIETEMLAGRDIGEVERSVICKAIDHLSGFLGLPNAAAEIERLERERDTWRDEALHNRTFREQVTVAADQRNEAERQRDEATEYAKYEQQRADGAVEEMKAVYVERDEATKRADEAIADGAKWKRRYDYVRALSVPDFARLFTRCCVLNLRYDDEVDAAIAARRLLNQKEGT